MTDTQTRTLEVYFPPRNQRRYGPRVSLGLIELHLDNGIEVAFSEAWHNVVSLYGDEPHASRSALQLEEDDPHDGRLRWTVSTWEDGDTPRQSDIDWEVIGTR